MVSLACKSSPGLSHFKFCCLVHDAVDQFSMDLETCEQEWKTKVCTDRCCFTPQAPTHGIIRKTGLLVPWLVHSIVINVYEMGMQLLYRKAHGQMYLLLPISSEMEFKALFCYSHFDCKFVFLNMDVCSIINLCGGKPTTLFQSLHLCLCVFIMQTLKHIYLEKVLNFDLLCVWSMCVFVLVY